MGKKCLETGRLLFQALTAKIQLNSHVQDIVLEKYESH